MATQIVALSMDARLLRRALRGNATFSAISGIAFLADGGPIAAFLGLKSPTSIVVLGVALLLFAAGLFWDTAQASINKRNARIIIALDVAWVIGSIALIALDPIGLTSAGKWAILVVADIVAALAVVEYVGLRRAVIGAIR
jgi:hypothetical protein